MDKLIRKYLNKKLYDYSYRETMLHAANDYFNLHLSETDLSMISPLNGDMFEGELCSVVNSCTAILELLFNEHAVHETDIFKAAVVDYKKEFKEAFGTSIYDNNCNELNDEINGCTDIIVKGGLILVAVVKKYQKLQEYMNMIYTSKS